ncbi:MAG: Tripartite-type tricarboxylate transporter, receptor component TctC [Hyphomicrobiales bacterium]|nr:Tripartite-type tricarboxylate transporter, receptor component TctC [Hyphomicrobiales bacterium]
MTKASALRAALILGVAFAWTTQARAETVADFYKGKDVRMLISHPPGGGYDVYARFFARHLSKFLPGNPNVVPQNMPGAAGVVMANSMATQQPSDGTVIGLGPGSIGTADLFGASGARYDARKLSWIGSMNADVGVSLAWHTAPVKNADDLMKTELIVGGGGATDQSVLYPTALNRILGTKFKLIPGYGGSAATSLAMERGETFGIGGMNFSSVLANKPDWLRDKKINILVQLALERHPDLPNVPTVVELAKTDEQRDVLQLIFAQSSMGRAIFGPPGIPDDRLKALRGAFDAMMADKDVQAEADKLKIELNQPMPGEKMAQLVNRLYNVKPDVLKKAREAIKTN